MLYSTGHTVPYCNGCWGHLAGRIHRVHIQSPSRSSSGWGCTGHSCGQRCLVCRGNVQSAYHSDILHQYSSPVKCQQLHKYSLQDETECRIRFKCMNSFTVLKFSVTVLTPAVLGECVSIITQFTLRARVAISVIQALEALAGSWVTWLWVLVFNVPVALARPARPARLLGITIVTRSAAITARTWDRTQSVNLLN